MADELNCRIRKRQPSGFELNADLRIPFGESPVTVLFGPSGSGKTTLLRLIAGLEPPDEGEIRFRQQVWYDSSSGISKGPQQRRAGFLFQEYALFPHMTAAENVAYASRGSTTAHLMEAFDLAGFAARKPRELSGGQQQRVALARALAAEPALLLLDEPLSALDAAARARVRRDLRRMLRSGGVPSIVVTHDRMEAVTLGDWMAVMVQGRIRQAGPAPEVFRHPADAQVAEAVGVENVLPAGLVGEDAGLVSVAVGPNGETIQACPPGKQAGSDSPVWACIRAEDIVLARNSDQLSSARNRLPGRVRSVALEGALARVELDCGFPLIVSITSQSVAEMALREGDVVCAVVKATAVHLLTG